RRPPRKRIARESSADPFQCLPRLMLAVGCRSEPDQGSLPMAIGQAPTLRVDLRGLPVERDRVFPPAASTRRGPRATPLPTDTDPAPSPSRPAPARDPAFRALGRLRVVPARADVRSPLPRDRGTGRQPA